MLFILPIVILTFSTIIPIALAKPPPGKGKPNKESGNIHFIQGNVLGDVLGAVCSLDDAGRLTFARANPPRHCDNFILTFLPEDQVFWMGHIGGDENVPLDFSGQRYSNDFQIEISWTDETTGDISFWYWFDYDGVYGEDDDDNYKLLGSGEFTFDNDEYSVTLSNTEIQYRLGANTRGKDKYDHCWGPTPISFTFTVEVINN
jgi:hypothetical protein